MLEKTVEQEAIDLIHKIYNDLPEFNSDDPISGTDLVDYMCSIWERIVAIALAKE